jgi:hypothetical protein
MGDLAVEEEVGTGSDEPTARAFTFKSSSHISICIKNIQVVFARLQHSIQHVT